MSSEPGPVPDAVPVLPVADLTRSVAWYGRLGFAVRALHPDYAILGFGTTELHLAESPSVAGTESWSGCYLRVADAATVHASWLAAGVREVAPLADQPYGIREFATEDLDGNLWRVGSPTPGGPLDDDHDLTRADGADRTGPAPTDGGPGTDHASWAAVVADGTCAGCGIRAADGAVAGLAGRLRDEAGRWALVLLDADDDAVRRRPAPGTWSALEYGAHVRDVLALFAERTMRAQAEVDPTFAAWDPDAAIEDGWANESEVAAVVDDLARNASHLGEVLDRVAPDGWARPATRADGQRFTIELLARYALHEVVHHRVDAERSLAEA
ncbi:DinB family protein [Aquihabitans sp. G128]|uniref:DinB family protein n=1 Tax=Aquihabitans sp. G128 TaxID=2849779 RepID=UPI001C21732B|nr:DinB family protein [Aquihabitans sp. G128]QXC60061.1 DinB family protein [Aquihabitans sp. G128]